MLQFGAGFCYSEAESCTVTYEGKGEAACVL